MSDFPILSLIIFTPFVGVLFLLLVQGNNVEIYKKISLSFSILTLVLSVILVINFDSNNGNFQFEEKLSWINNFDINYQLGIDGISLFFIVLTTLLTTLCIVASWNSINTKIKEYLICFLLLEMLIIGVFSALDTILFYVFYEAILIPMFIIIGIWGGENRIYAAYKFFIYTLAGSLLLLMAIIYLYTELHSMDIKLLVKEAPKFSLTIQKYLFICFFASFAIKVPMWPLHTWLPDVHVQAPTSGSMILAGILIKVGAYGFLRFALPMLPDASHYFRDYIYILSIIAIIYSSLIAFVQTDIKKMIAYSSVAHMGFVTAGIFAFNKQSITGSIIQMISHGIVSGGLFYSIGVIYDRTHTREIANYGGISKLMPRYAMFFMILVMASIGLPGTSGFVGEFLIFTGTFKDNILASIFIIQGMVLGAVYMLSLYRRCFFGLPNNQALILKDLEKRELCIYIVLTSLIILIGIYPKIIIQYLDAPVNNLLSQIYNK